MASSARGATAAWLGRQLRRSVTVDTRSLAVFRISLGCLVLADLALRARNLRFLYSDAGIVPSSLVLELWGHLPVSAYNYVTSPRLVAAVFLLQALVAVQLIVGYKTRAAAVVSFLLVISLDHRNPFVLSYADTLFRLLFFWALFLPLGERWSIDGLHRQRLPRGTVTNVFTAFALCQMVTMYVVNGVHKTQSSLWTDGGAAPRVLGLDEMTFLLGDLVRQVPTLLDVGGRLWFFMMLCGWLLLVAPGRARTALVGLYVGGHASFALTVRIGAFAYVAIAGLVLFLQSSFWRDLQSVTRRLRGPSSLSLSGRRRRQIAAVVPAWGARGGRARRLKAGVFAVVGGAVVVAVVASLLVVGIEASASISDDTTAVTEIDRAVEQRLQETVGLRQVYTVATALGIDQPGWSVFAPTPRTTDRYHVFAAETVAGDRVDAFNDRPLSADRPYDGQLQKQYGTYRERFLFNSVRRAGPATPLPTNLAEHVCTSYRDRGTPLVGLTMYVVTEQVTVETITAPEQRDRSVRQVHVHGCGSNDPEPVSFPATDATDRGDLSRGTGTVPYTGPVWRSTG